MDFTQTDCFSFNKEFYDFIITNINADTNVLRLKNYKDYTFDVKFAILQIDCRKRIKEKLPEIYNIPSFIFPSILATEQCTAQEIAKFHASLLTKDDNVLDMTCGLCVDTYYMSKKAKRITALDINTETAAVSEYNMKNLAENVSVLNQDCTQYIEQCTEHYDVIFIDPARRGDNNIRLFGLTDCIPNIIELIPKLKHIGDTLYIKASPMIDITQSLKLLNYCVSDIWVLGLNNECKELLFKVDLKEMSIYVSPILHTINYMKSGTQVFVSNNSNTEENSPHGNSIETSQFLYEPNCCIMKAALYPAIESQYEIRCIQKNSHLFIGSHVIEQFPGRSFKIIEIIPFKSKNIKNLCKKYPQLNVSTRNFKLKAEELKKKLNVKDGGTTYLFGTTDNNNDAIMIICKKID